METSSPLDARPRLNGSASPSRSSSGSLFFQPPEPEPAPEPRQSPETLTGEPAEPVEPLALDEDGWDSVSESPSDDEHPDSDPTSSPASSAADPVKVASKSALRATTRQAVLIGSGMAHRFGARSEGQIRTGLYLADDDDAAAVGDPLASILHRRGGIAGGAMSPDAADAVQMMLGLAGYASKQIARLSAAREIDAHVAAGGTVDV